MIGLTQSEGDHLTNARSKAQHAMPMGLWTMYLSRYTIALLCLTHHVASEEHWERGEGGRFGCEHRVRPRGAVTEHTSTTDAGRGVATRRSILL